MIGERGRSEAAAGEGMLVGSTTLTSYTSAIGEAGGVSVLGA